MRTLSRPGLAALVVMVASSLAQNAAALPLFARSESAPCARCHVSPPQLNAYGVRYLIAGFRAPGETGHTVSGAALPVSIVAEWGASFARTDSTLATGVRASRNSGAFRVDALDLRSAGVLAPAVSYGLEVGFDSTASAVRAPVAFVQFELLPRGAFSVKAGRFETGLRLLSADRAVTRAPYLAPVAIAAEGVELSGTHAGWTTAVGLANSDRTPTGADSLMRSFNRLENTYGWAMRSIAGQMLGARLLFARQASNISYHAWLQRLQLELGASLGTDRFRVTPAYVLDRFDDRPVAGKHQRHQYAVLEVLALLDARGTNTLALRAEHEHVTPTGPAVEEDHDLEAVRFTRWVTPGVGVALEGAHVGDNRRGPHETRLGATVTLAY